MLNQLPVLDGEPTAKACCRWNPLALGVVIGLSIAAIAGAGYGIGRWSQGIEQTNHWNGIPRDRVPPELLQATATHGGANLAIATGQIDESSEGFFALDFLTGDLKCWVYYPRQGAFGGMFYTNVQAQLGMSKNPEYLLITGAAEPASVGSNIRPAACLVYVVDTKSGFFSAYTIPWNRTLESSSAMQGGAMLPVGGGQIREPQSGVKKPINPPNANKNDPKKPAGVGPAFPNPAGGPMPAGANPGVNPAADPFGQPAADPFGKAPGNNPNAPVNPRKP
ncbi:hypothetical protein SH467x_001680 [Pirellulaceae bacterium SH467]